MIQKALFTVKIGQFVCVASCSRITLLGDVHQQKGGDCTMISRSTDTGYLLDRNACLNLLKRGAIIYALHVYSSTSHDWEDNRPFCILSLGCVTLKITLDDRTMLHKRLIAYSYFRIPYMPVHTC